MPARLALSLVFALSLAACQSLPVSGVTDVEATEGAEEIDYAADPASWRDVDPENLMRIVVPYGDIWIELYPDFAPASVAQMKTLIRADHFTDATFYRVIDGFVAQGGVFSEVEGDDGVATLTREFEISRAAFEAQGAVFTPLGSPDLFADEVGHANGVAVGRDVGSVWPLHCPGATALARDTDPDTGSSHLYIVLDAQRYLDRNLTVFGQVISGMQHVQKLNRGDRAVDGGVIAEPERRDPMLSVSIAADLPVGEVPAFQVMRTDGPAFEAAKRAKRVRTSDFFFRTPPEVIDACFVPVPVRLRPEEEE